METTTDFETPRPHWATVTDLSSEDWCIHIRDFSVGDVSVVIRQEDRLIDGQTVYGRPEVVVQTFGAGAVLSPPQIMNLSKTLQAAAHHFARIGRA